MKKFGASLVVAICAVLSILSISSACMYFYYQPELPQKANK